MQREGRIGDTDWRHTTARPTVVYQPARIRQTSKLAGLQWAKTTFYKRLAPGTGLWWNIARNVGYHFGLGGEVRARAAMHGA